MSLHSGLDTVGICSIGNWTKTYGSGSPGAIANLHASIGYLEDAPNIAIKVVTIIMQIMNQYTGGSYE